MQRRFWSSIKAHSPRLSDRLQEAKAEGKALRQISADCEQVKRIFGPEQGNAAAQTDKQRKQVQKVHKRPRYSVDRSER